jgi:hypothetical protein
MIGATVVLANSTVVNCSTSENPDLFWAMRGAGSSMGIVASFKFNTFKVPDVVTFFTASLPWANQQRASAGFKAVQEFAASGAMPSELNMRVLVTGHFVNLEGMFWGDEQTLRTTLAPLIAKTNATLQLVTQGGWVDQAKHFSEGVPLNQGHPYNYVCLYSFLFFYPFLILFSFIFLSLFFLPFYLSLYFSPLFAPSPIVCPPIIQYTLYVASKAAGISDANNKPNNNSTRNSTPPASTRRPCPTARSTRS